MKTSFTRSLALLCAFLMLLSVSGVYAVWRYTMGGTQGGSATGGLGLSGGFDYTPPMPDAEVTLLERMFALLNNEYSNDVIGEGEGRSYLLSTMDKDWEAGHNPVLGSFVGSMDPTAESKARIEAMFGDVLDLDKVSFILKSEDLVGTVDNEIALYSTTDPLLWNESYWTPMVVGVYLSVFVPACW